LSLIVILILRKPVADSWSYCPCNSSNRFCRCIGFSPVCFCLNNS
jgi:hypothetical protein